MQILQKFFATISLKQTLYRLGANARAHSLLIAKHSLSAADSSSKRTRTIHTTGHPITEHRTGSKKSGQMF